MKAMTNILLFKKGDVERVLEGAARAFAYDINTEIDWEEHPSVIIETAAAFVRWTPVIRHLLPPGAETPGAAAVNVKLSKFHDDRRNFFNLFYKNWMAMSAKGPAQGCLYLAEKWTQAQRCWRNMQDRFNMARQVNDIASRELNSSIVFTFYVKTAADVAMNAYGTWGPLGFLANTAVSIGYTGACKLAENMEEANTSEIVGWTDIASAEASTVGNYAQEVTQANEKAARAVADSMLASRNEAVMEGLKKPGQFVPSTGNMTPQWVERTGRLGRAAINAENAAAKASRAASAARGGSFVVGLLFMAPQLKTALLTGNPVSDSGQEAIVRRLSR
jgi:hypothetical protein